MKNVFLGFALMLSFSAFADSIVEDSARLTSCEGKVELRSHIGSEGEIRYSLQLIGVKNCSNVRLSVGKDYKLTDKDGNFAESKNFTLSNEAIEAAHSAHGLGVLVESNNGHTKDEVAVKLSAPVQPAPAPAPAPARDYEYESSEW